MILLIGMGAAAILGQVVLLRDLLVAFYGSELIYLLAFGFLLISTAAGTLLAGRCARTGVDAERGSGAEQEETGWLLLLMSGATPGLLVLTRGLHALLGGVPGAYLSFAEQLAGMGLVLFPFGALVGFLYARLAVRWVANGGKLATAYALDSAGGLAGGLAATALLAAGVGNLGTALSCGWLGLLLAAWFARRQGRSRLLWGVWLTAAGLLLIGVNVAALDRYTAAWQHPGIRSTKDTPYGRVSVARRSGQTILYINGALAYEDQGTGVEVFAHMAALQVASPRRILLLGGVGRGVLIELLAHHPERVDVVEADQDLLRLVSETFPTAHTRALKDPAVRTHVADPRRFVGNAGHYDLILVDAGSPDSGRTNRLYTREFFALCRRHLGPEGVLAFSLEAAENLWSPALTQRTASIHGAVAAAFPDVLVLPGGIITVLASADSLHRAPAVLARRWRSRELRTRLISPPYIRYLLTNDRFAGVRRLLRETQAPVNTDARPICYPYTLVLWLSRFFPRLATVEWLLGTGLGMKAWAMVAGGWIVVLLFARRTAMWRAVLVAGAGGAAGMLIQSILLLHYQTHSGVLYRDLGLLITLFMAGLTLGALLLDRSLAQWKGPACLLGGALALDVALLCGLAVWLVRAGAWGGLVSTGLLLGLVGLEAGGLFAYASNRHGRGQAEAIAPLYAADLVGGCVAALLGTVLVIPLLGLDGGLLLAAFVAGSLVIVV